MRRVQVDAPNPLSLKHRFLAFSVSVSGIFLVFGGMIVLNRVVDEPEPSKNMPAVSFTVSQSPEKQERKPRQQFQQRQESERQPVPAPFPVVEGFFPGIQVEIPDYLSYSLDSISESLIGGIDENIVMTEETVDILPVVLSSPITYPERAKQRNIEGTVVVNILIGTEGAVKSILILDAYPPGVFEETVMQALPLWRFSPAVYNERNVEMWATVSIPFRTQ